MVAEPNQPRRESVSVRVCPLPRRFPELPAAPPAAAGTRSVVAWRTGG